MGSYEDVKNDVWDKYDAVLARAEGRQSQEGIAATGIPGIPGVSVSGSKPAWLGDGWRAGLTVASLAGCLIGLSLLWWAVTRPVAEQAGSWAAGFGAGFAVIALVVAYMTVAGFGDATFSIGSGGESAERDGADESAHRAPDRRTQATLHGG